MKLLAICTSLLLAGLPGTVTGQITSASSPFDLVITEVMADPDPPVGLPDQEFCELYNRSTNPVNLAGWTFYDGSSRVLPAITIEPGEYVIICDDNDTALFSGYGKCAFVTSISLTNTGEKIAIRDPSGFPVDSVTYSDTWYGTSFKKDGGWSLEKVDAGFTCPVSTNWQPSINPLGGSPGSGNSVAGTILDDQPPALLRSYCPDSISVVLVFDEPLDPAVGLQIQHYYFSHDLIPITAAFEDALLKRVKILLDVAVTPGIIYTALVTGITDCSGNEIPPESTVRFGLGDTNSSDGLVLNEVLFNPFTDGVDFIELFHSGNSIIDLSQIRVESMDLLTGAINESEKIAEEQWLLFPGDYLVITESATTVAVHYRTSYPYNFMEVENLPAMNVDEGHIRIAINENVLDAFHYSEAYHFELLEELKGISLEKINPFLISTDPASWHSAAESAGFATPGLKNSQYAALEQPSKQVSLSPEIFSPDNDGMDDVVIFTLKTGTPGYISNIRIYNAGGQVIFENAHNALVSTDDAFAWNGITDAGVRAPTGVYAALVEVFNLGGDVKKYKLPFVLAIKL